MMTKRQGIYWRFFKSTWHEVKRMTVEKCIVVEGPADQVKVAPVIAEEVAIICTYGTISEEALIELIEPYEDCELYTLFDADDSGERLRKLMNRTYSEAIHLYIPKTYIEVEKTPRKILASILKAAKFQIHEQYLV